MRIHRSRPGKHFTQIANAVLRDDRLSYAARGVLCELLSRPDGWDVNADALAAEAQAKRAKCGEGRRPMRGIFAELTAAGYLTRTRYRSADGRVVTELHLYDQPQGPGCTDVPPPGMPEPPAVSPVSPVGTDVPPTDVPPSGTSNRTRSTNTEHGREDLASRRARAKREREKSRTIDDVIEATRAAAIDAYGGTDCAEVSDDEWLGLYCTHKGSTEVHDVRAYMGKIFGDAPYLDTFLANSEPVCVACAHWESQCRCAVSPGQPAA